MGKKRFCLPCKDTETRKKDPGDEVMKNKEKLSRLKKRITQSHAVVIMLVLAVYVLLSYFYWMTEIGPGGKKTFWDILLWNNINIVLGRGFTDYIPTSWKGRALLMLFIMFSLLFLSTIIGFISSKINEYRNSPTRRIKKVLSLSNHVVIIGWKNDLKTLICDIIRKSNGLTAEDIVLINNVNNLKMESLMMDKDLKGLHYIRGEFTEEQTLLNANIQKASTALVIGEAHETLDPELIDSRIFVCTLMIKSLSPRCHVCALVQTERYRNYLEAQKCDEVIYTEEYSRYILSTATNYTGMANVLRAMFDNGNGISIQILPVGDDWREKPYVDLAKYYKDQGTLALGILENMGAETTIKHATLAEAMKASNYGEIIQKLKTVKDTERNHPLLNPPDDYILGSNMGVIVLTEEI